jgi:IS5 family transposase
MDPLSPKKRTVRSRFAPDAAPRIHFLQQLFSLSDLAMEAVLFDLPLCREFARLGGTSRLLNRVRILRFRPELEKHPTAEKYLQVVNAHLAHFGMMLRDSTMFDTNHLDRGAFLDEA